MIARMNALSRWVLVILLLLLSLLSTINAHAQATRAVIDTAPEQLRAPPPPPPGGETMYNDASFGTQSVPTTMTAGATYTVTLSMFNSGTKTWSPALSYALGSRNPTDNVTWGGGRVGLAGFINPGQSATFTFNVTAPSSPGSYNFQWGMVQDGVEWFGVLSTNVVVNVVAPARVNGASIVGMSVTGQMTAGLSYPATIVMQNTGNTTWTSAALYSLGAPQVGGVQYWNGGRVPLPGSIAPGQQVSFSFNVTAPANAGTYPFNFLMVQDGV
ncbi:NBR1-Ig-like domain-containing protein, partial [Massilia sp. PWRC2]|uniref:NBR1-Ig-like domain-containing protein n=1 Tax=Massilia sp. PWRC2 TaxID=2804626 RepID=UPI003CEC6121